MSCYFRHMKSALDELGVELTPGNKKKVDQAFYQILGVTYKDCPTTWKRLKKELASDSNRKQELIHELRNTIR